MVVVAAVGVHLPATEEPSHLVEHTRGSTRPGDGEFRSNLPLIFIASFRKRAAKTAFPIDETHQPSDGEESFLLVFRTPAFSLPSMSSPYRRGRTSTTSSEGSPGFPAYSRLRISWSPTRGAAPPGLLGGIPTLGIVVTPLAAGCCAVVRSFLPDSSCRHEDRTVSSPGLPLLGGLACSL